MDYLYVVPVYEAYSSLSRRFSLAQAMVEQERVLSIHRNRSLMLVVVDQADQVGYEACLQWYKNRYGLDVKTIFWKIKNGCFDIDDIFQQIDEVSGHYQVIFIFAPDIVSSVDFSLFMNQITEYYNLGFIDTLDSDA